MKGSEQKLDEIKSGIHRLDKKIDAIILTNQYHLARLEKVEKRNDKLTAAIILAAVGFAAVHGPQVLAVMKVLL